MTCEGFTWVGLTVWGSRAVSLGVSTESVGYASRRMPRYSQILSAGVHSIEGRTQAPLCLAIVPYSVEKQVNSRIDFISHLLFRGRWPQSKHHLQMQIVADHSDEAVGELPAISHPNFVSLLRRLKDLRQPHRRARRSRQPHRANPGQHPEPGPMPLARCNTHR